GAAEREADSRGSLRVVGGQALHHGGVEPRRQAVPQDAGRAVAHRQGLDRWGDARPDGRRRQAGVRVRPLPPAAQRNLDLARGDGVPLFRPHQGQLSMSRGTRALAVGVLVVLLAGCGAKAKPAADTSAPDAPSPTAIATDGNGSAVPTNLPTDVPTPSAS